MPFLSLRNTLFLLVTITDLDGGITFLLLALYLEDTVATGLDNRDGTDATLGVIDTGHADFLAENADAHCTDG
jgi:hypothetical protein